MITEQQIKELAYYIWENDGRPMGNDLEYYYRARKMLEDKEANLVIELPESLPKDPVPPMKRSRHHHSKRRNNKDY